MAKKKVTPGWFFYVARAVLKPVFWFLYRVKVEGKANLPKEGGVLVLANHLSAMDTILMPVFAPRPVQFLAKASLFTGNKFSRAIKSWFMLNIGSIPLSRSASKAAKGSLDEAVKYLNQGVVLGAFPEGTRSDDGRLYKGKPGSAWIALEATNVQVLPTGLIRTKGMKPFAWLKGKNHRPIIKFGKPMEIDSYRELGAMKARQELTIEIIRQIQLLTGQEVADEIAVSRDSA